VISARATSERERAERQSLQDGDRFSRRHPDIFAFFTATRIT
jgi:hypothetical protein